MIKSTYTKVTFKIIHVKNPIQIQFFYVCIIMRRKQLKKYLNGLLSIMVGGEEVMSRLNQWFINIHDFIKKHAIFPYNDTISNISEYEQYITYMKPAGFINGQCESRCYFNS